MQTTTGIEIKNVSLGYKKPGADLILQKDIHLTFNAGEFVGVMGLNGAGKSTLLKTISGLLPVLKGDIFIEGKHLAQIPLDELARMVSIVTTEKIGGFNLTAYDVVAAGQMPYTNSFHRLEKEHMAIIERAIEICGIQQHRLKPLNELSDGLFQRTVIARALAQQTQIMLLDEPGAFLDYASKHDLFLLLKKLAAENNKCILVSAHDLDLLLRYCNKLLIFNEGAVELIDVEDAPKNAAFKLIGGGYI